MSPVRVDPNTGKKVIKVSIASKTPKTQRERKIEGTKAEYVVATDLKRRFPRKKIFVNSQKGVDIVMTNGTILSIEVKSLRTRFIRKRKTKTKGLQYDFREGTAILKQSDYLSSDLFAFVIKPTLRKGNHIVLNPKKPWIIKYVRTIEIVKYLKAKGLFMTGKSTKITVSKIFRFPNAQLATIIK